MKLKLHLLIELSVFFILGGPPGFTTVFTVVSQEVAAEAAAPGAAASVLISF